MACCLPLFQNTLPCLHLLMHTPSREVSGHFRPSDTMHETVAQGYSPALYSTCCIWLQIHTCRTRAAITRHTAAITCSTWLLPTCSTQAAITCSTWAAITHSTQAAVHLLHTGCCHTQHTGCSHMQYTGCYHTQYTGCCPHAAHWLLTTCSTRAAIHTQHIGCYQQQHGCQ